MQTNSLPEFKSIKDIPIILDDRQQSRQQMVKDDSSSSSDSQPKQNHHNRMRLATGVILKRRKRDASQKSCCSDWSVSSNSSMRGNYRCYSNLYNSKILSTYGKLQLLFKQKVQIKLIFSGSQEGFSSKRFHQLCDLYTGTLVICLTQSNKIIGGYTTLSWKENYDKNKTYFKSDEKYQSFMFSWDRKEKYSLVKSKHNRAICCFNGFGPCFGYDLQIGNDTFSNTNTSVAFPSNYCLPQKAQTPTRFQVFGTSKNQIRLKDYEVYQIIKRQSRNSRNKGRVGLLTARQQICLNINNRLNQTDQLTLEKQGII